MAVFYLFRHGEADYSQINTEKFWGFGRDFAPLSAKGIKQVENSAQDERLKQANIIVSSPYTRAMQTAVIISRVTGLQVDVDVDLHEWIPDKSNRYSSSHEAALLSQEFTKNKGVYPVGKALSWETLSEMRTRMKRVTERYAIYDKVILVGHGMAFRALTYIEEMEPAGIVECNYQIGQADCEYSFY